MQNGTYYKKMLHSIKYINDLPEFVLDHLFFGNETRKGVLKAEIFFLRNELTRVDPHLVPLIQEVIHEKKILHSKLND